MKSKKLTKEKAQERIQDIDQAIKEGDLRTAGESSGDLTMELGDNYSAIGKNEKAGNQYGKAGDRYMIARNAYNEEGNTKEAERLYGKAIRALELMVERHGVLTASIFFLVGIFISKPIFTGNIISNSYNSPLNVIGISLIAIGIIIFIKKFKN